MEARDQPKLRSNDEGLTQFVWVCVVLSLEIEAWLILAIHPVQR